MSAIETPQNELGLSIGRLADIRQAPDVPDALRQFVDIDTRRHIVFVSDLKENDPDFRFWVDRLYAHDVPYDIHPIPAQLMDERHLQRSLGSEATSDESGVDSLVQQQAVDLLKLAADSEGSDIHISVGQKHAELEFRINGDIQRQRPMELEESKSLLATIMNSMVGDGSSMYKPGERQDARISNPRFLPPGLGSVRIASGPLADEGRYMVLRLLYKDTNKVGGSLEERLVKLGYDEEHQLTIRLAWDKPSGINIIAGPTGSGKSTTLKHVLEAKKEESPEENFLSVEDPPEYTISGVRQIPVNNAKGSSARGEAFSDVIRFALRADPDQILVGEIRDRESLRLAMQAAMSGHGVAASLHANSAFGILQRAFDLLRSPETPDPAALIADETILTGLIFQRLVKTTCLYCSTPLKGNEDRLHPQRLLRFQDVLAEEDMDQVRLINTDGCEHCEYQGVSGRAVVAEVVVTDAEMMELVRRDGITAAKRYWLEVQKGKSIFQHALTKVKKGILDPGQAERAVGPINTEFLDAKRHHEQMLQRERERAEIRNSHSTMVQE